MPNGVPMSWMLGLHRHAPVFAARGEKAWFTDVDGNRYLDMNLSDLSATTGFGHPAITRAIARQAHARRAVPLAGRGFDHGRTTPG